MDMYPNLSSTIQQKPLLVLQEIFKTLQLEWHPTSQLPRYQLPTELFT
jgi:hypothetical protein